MSNQKLIDQLRGVVRQTEREAAARELYLNRQIERLKERLVDALVDKAVLQDAFEGGWVARDSGAVFSEIIEWYETWVEDEERKL